MSVTLSSLAGAGQQFLDNNGKPLSGGKLYSYAAGTTTPQTTYTTAAGNVAHTNPIILDSAGRIATGEIWLTAGSNYKFELTSSTNTSIAVWDNITGINGTGISSNASMVVYDPAGTGVVTTTVQAKLRQTISVKDFGAVGNNFDNDQTAISNAVNVCVGSGAWLYWPPGTYVTTANISNFHNVRHVGPGAVKRGGNVYYVDPLASQTVNLYVSSTGSLSNDGLSATEPMATIQQAIDALSFDGRVCTNPCVISCAAGSITGKVSIPDGRFSSDGYLTIQGPPQASVQTTPTFAVDGTGISANAAFDVGRRNNVKVMNIKFNNWTTAIDGVQCGVGGLVWLYNCHSTDGKLRALLILDRAATGYVTGGIKDGGTYAFDIYSASTLTLGYNATSTADSTIIRNHTAAGLYCKSGAHVVASYVLFEDNTVAVRGYHRTRFDARGTDFRRNTRVYKMQGSFISEDISRPPVYNYGTANANTIVYDLQQYSAEDIMYTDGRGGLSFGQRTTGTTLTGTIGATLAKTIKTVPAYLFISQTGRQIEIEVVVNGTGTASTKTIQLYLGNTVVGTYTLASGSVWGKLRCVLWVSNSTSMIAVNEVTGSFTLVSALRSAVVVDNTVDQDIAVYATIPGASDTVTVYEANVIYWG